jgi:DNA-binding NarL/FixJ family response regulator
VGDLRVLVADDQQLVRESIAALLDIQDGMTVVGTAVDGRDAVAQTEALQPDVVLMDVRMPGLDGVAAVSLIRERLPSTRVLMLSTFDDEDLVVRALRAGAAGYLLKDLPARELADAVRLAHAGVAQFDPAALARLVAVLERSPLAEGPSAGAVAPAGGPLNCAGRAAGLAYGALLARLTAREVEVLRQLAAGSSNREIAARLYLSEGTVKNHVSRILGRLGLRDRVQAAIYAREHDLLR